MSSANDIPVLDPSQILTQFKKSYQLIQPDSLNSEWETWNNTPKTSYKLKLPEFKKGYYELYSKGFFKELEKLIKSSKSNLRNFSPLFKEHLYKIFEDSPNFDEKEQMVNVCLTLIQTFCILADTPSTNLNEIYKFYENAQIFIYIYSLKCDACEAQLVKKAKLAEDIDTKLFSLSQKNIPYQSPENPKQGQRSCSLTNSIPYQQASTTSSSNLKNNSSSLKEKSNTSTQKSNTTTQRLKSSESSLKTTTLSKTSPQKTVATTQKTNASSMKETTSSIKSTTGSKTSASTTLTPRSNKTAQSATSNSKTYETSSSSKTNASVVATPRSSTNVQSATSNSKTYETSSSSKTNTSVVTAPRSSTNVQSATSNSKTISSSLKDKNMQSNTSIQKTSNTDNSKTATLMHTKVDQLQLSTTLKSSTQNTPNSTRPSSRLNRGSSTKIDDATIRKLLAEKGNIVMQLESHPTSKHNCENIQLEFKKFVDHVKQYINSPLLDSYYKKFLNIAAIIPYEKGRADNLIQCLDNIEKQIHT